MDEHEMTTIEKKRKQGSMRKKQQQKILKSCFRHFVTVISNDSFGESTYTEKFRELFLDPQT
jgi:hypothetical protein